MPDISILLWAAALAASPAPADPLAGRWHGTSLCQVKASACRDEEAVYYFVPRSGGGYTVTMDKIVAGVEVEMGPLDVTFAPATGLLTGVTHDRRGAPASWSFTRHGDRLSGRLVTDGGTLFRLIELRREPAPAR
ncbi:MAG: hypothetical protein ACJ8EB_09720 [Allosphingosinicella sp.]